MAKSMNLIFLSRSTHLNRFFHIHLSLIALFLNIAGNNLALSASKASPCNSQTERFSNYQKTLDKYAGALGPLGDSSKNEIEIILDPKQMKEIEGKTGRTI